MVTWFGLFLQILIHTQLIVQWMKQTYIDIIKLRGKIREIKGDEKGNSGSRQHVVIEDQNVILCYFL